MSARKVYGVRRHGPCTISCAETVQSACFSCFNLLLSANVLAADENINRGIEVRNAMLSGILPLFYRFLNPGQNCSVRTPEELCLRSGTLLF